MKAVFASPLVLVLAAALGACTATGNYPIEVTRFHAGQPIARGTVSIEPFDAPDRGPGTLGPEFDLYANAVAEQLARLGWTLTGSPGQADYVVLIGIEEDHYTQRESGPVSVGVGGGTGGWNGGVGGGLGFNLGGGPRELVTGTLNVRIKQRADDKVFWEGRAKSTARADRPEGSPQALAPRLATALFQGFPGESGRTIRVP